MRLAAVVGITVTGVVHFLLLRPLLDLSGADWVADKLLHMVVPVLAFVGWALFGPRPRIDWREIRWAVCWPLAWLAVILVLGAATGWYPYPFLDHREPEGTAGVVVTSIGITGFFLALFWLARLYDRRAATLHDRPRTGGPRPRRLARPHPLAHEVVPVGRQVVDERRADRLGLEVGPSDRLRLADEPGSVTTRWAKSWWMIAPVPTLTKSAACSRHQATSAAERTLPA